MKHTFQNLHADGTDATLTKPSNWNDFHVYAVAFLSSSQTLNTTTHDHILASGGAGGITLTLPPTAGLVVGRPYHIKKTDSAAGFVTIAANASQNIDGLATYILVNQGQYVEVYFDGTNWQIRGNN